MKSRPPLPQITSGPGVPFNSSPAPVPVMVHGGRAEAVTGATTTIAATETRVARILSERFERMAPPLAGTDLTLCLRADRRKPGFSASAGVAAEVGVEPPLEVREPIVDPIETLVDTVEASTHVGAQGIDAGVETCPLSVDAGGE